MGQILSVDPDFFKQVHLERSQTMAASSLVSCTHDFQWEHGLEFPVEAVSKSVLVFDVMRKLPVGAGNVCGSEEKLGTYQFHVAELVGVAQGTTWKTVDLAGTAMKLNLSWALGASHVSSDFGSDLDQPGAIDGQNILSWALGASRMSRDF